MTKKEIPKGLHKCEVCGEYKGKVLKRDLNWGNDDIDVVESIKRVTGRDQSELEKSLSATRDAQRQSEEIITVSCLCDGILCPGCKKNKIHRPSSNSYDPESNTIGHWPGITFAGQYLCGECRKKTKI
jgi:hypothetical protein